jgi:hypothetical protein
MKQLLFSVLLLAFLSLVIGCKGDRGDIGPTGPEGPTLAINTLSAEPPIVEFGDTTRLISSVVFHGNGTLAYQWTATSGTILSPTTAGAWWIAPTNTTSYGSITLSVSGDGDTVRGFLSIPVNGTIPTDGQVAYYPFNGNSNDESGNNRDLTNYGAALTTDRFGNANSAYSFDGVSSYLQVNAFPAFLTNFTYSAWIKVTDAGLSDKNNNFWSYGVEGAGLSTWDVGYNVNRNFIAVADLTNGAWMPTLVDIGSQWTHALFVYAGTTRSIYINGVLFAGPQNITTPISSPHPSNNLRIGRHINDGSQRFEGMIDDLRFYGHALSESEILQLYHEGGW